MKQGAKVQVMGVHRTIAEYATRTVERDGEQVEEEYVSDRYDAPREGLAGEFVREEPRGRVVVLLESGTEISTEAENVEAVS